MVENGKKVLCNYERIYGQCVISNVTSTDEFKQAIQDLKKSFSQWQIYVEKIDIKSSNFIELPVGSFDNFTALVDISTSKNGLKKISTEFITPKTYERCFVNIDLSFNALKEIDEDTFRRVGCIKSLNLTFNQIVYIKENAFAAVRIGQLLLNDNFIKSVEFINQIQYLRMLNVSRNDIEKFNCLNLGKVQITAEENIKVTDVSLINCGSYVNFHRCYSIKNVQIENVNISMSLNLSDCNMQRDVIVKTVLQLNDVIELDLSNNSIGDLNINTFASFKNLKVLKLSSTGMRRIPSGLLSSINNLERLDISNNNFSNRWQPWFDIFKLFPMKNLRFLNISNNQLKIMKNVERFKQVFPKLVSIDLAGNLFSCSDLVSYFMFIESEETRIVSNKTEINHSNIRGIRCNE